MQNIKNKEIDELIQWLFQEHKIPKLVFSSTLIERHRVLNFVPFQQTFKALRNEQQQISIKHINALFEITKLFDEKQIPIIHLKGAVLSYHLYEDFTKRCYVDLDLLVEEKNIEEAIANLKSLHYTIKDPYFKTPKQKEIFLRYFHHITFYHPETNCFVELHWKLAASRFISKTFQEEVWISTNIIHFASNKLMICNEVEEFIYLCVHGSRHNFDRLSWLVDLQQYIKMKDDQFLDKVLTKAFTYKLSNYVFHALYLLSEFNPNFEIPSHLTDFKGHKLCQLTIKQLKNSQTKSALKKYLEFYQVIYILYGLKGVLIEINSRRIKPTNWSFLYFPDSVFFLNQVFSRPIWIIRKLAKK